MKRNKFSLSHTKLLSCDMGSLISIAWMETLPGDTFQHATTCMVRCSPLLSPVMHPVHVRIHHWYVPLRLIWDDFEDFITGGPAGVSVPQPPRRLNTGGAALGTLGDYLGVPIAVPGPYSALPVRAYDLIWNEWYRDQDLETELTISTASGDDTTTTNALQNCAWEKDYFTSARPWEQKGPSITIPLGDTAPVNYVHANTTPWRLRNATSGAVETSATNTIQGSVTTGDTFKTGSSAPVQFDPLGNLEADLSGASAITVTALREALALQRYEEARARFGSRYVEYLRYLGVRSSDARLQRPEYLGGGLYPLQFSEVLQTAEGTNPVGTLAGHGLGVSRSSRYRRFFEEHGIVMSLMSVKPKTMYAQGLFRKFNRSSKEMYWQKELEHVGQQEIANREIYMAHASPDATFGYQDRYDEYRREESTVAGAFRPGQNLDYWNFARSFGTTPALNADFVKCVPSEEPFAVPSEHTLYVMARHSIQARRMVAKTGTSYIF